MFIVIPHVGKSHLTARLVQSIPDAQQVILIDGSYVRDMSAIAANRDNVTYHPTGGVPHCLAKNWNLGASLVPDHEPWWMFCASDIEFHPNTWQRIATLERNFPDCGIIKDQPTNWNVWLVRRWAWDLLAPMDERYQPCGGEDDDLVMKCQLAGVKIKEGIFQVGHQEGGHATRIDIGDEGRGTTWHARHHNIALFSEKWGCKPAKGRDPKYRAAIAETHLKERRSEPPEEFTIPRERPEYPEKTLPEWPEPLKLNLGCGMKRMEGYVNVDLPGKGFSDFGLDVVNGAWPWQDGTVERVESYHFLEHLDEEEGLLLMERAFSCLKSGGVFVAETPDLEALCKSYPRRRRHGRWAIYGKAKWGEPMRHKWGYCADMFRLVLGRLGFVDIKTGPGTDYHHTKNICPSVRVEAVKP